MIPADCSSSWRDSNPVELCLWQTPHQITLGRESPEEENRLGNKSIYVGNLSYQTTEQELRDLFEQWGPITDVRVVQGRGFGFVDLPEENMSEAIDQMNGKEFQGRTLTVNEARPRSDSGGRGRGRDSYSGNRRGRW